MKSRRVVFTSSQAVVIDDFLDSTTFQRVLHYCGNAHFQTVHANQWRKVWRITDGQPLQGGTVYWAPPEVELPDVASKARHPIGADIDLFVEQMLPVLPDVQDIIGAAGRDWSDFTVAPWIYPPGSALSLHQDGFRYSGAFTFFAHRRWNIHWGGYLLVLDPATPTARDWPGAQANAAGISWIDDTDENSRLWEPGFAHCIFPKPNRLVFLSPEAQHLLSRVDPNAGQHPRISVAGFFRRRQAQKGDNR